MAGETILTGGRYYRINKYFSPGALERLLAPAYNLGGPGEGAYTRFVFYDTFDGRLLKKRSMIIEQEKTLFFFGKDGAFDTMSFYGEGSALNGPLDPSSFPIGRAAEQAVAAAKGRALLPAAVLHGRWSARDIIGGDGAAARLLRITFTGTASLRVLRLVPLPGREEDGRRIADRVAGKYPPLDDLPGEAARLGRLLPGPAAFREKPKTSKEELLAPAFAEILETYARRFEACIPGIRFGWDTEFLHDYRVILRKMSAVLSAGKKVFPPELILHLIGRIKELAAPTGRARDLDVLLAREERYEEGLPDELREGLAVFFRRLKEERDAAYGELAKLMVRGRYAAARKAFKNLSAPGAFPPPFGSFAESAIGETAGEWIRKKAERVRRSAGKVKKTGSPEDLHRLRLQGKGLRYLLESFGPLIDPAVTKDLVRNLKLFQDVLGKYQDLSIQRDLLSGALDGMRDTGRENILAAAAIGGILAELKRGEKPLLRAIRSEAAKLKKRLSGI